MAEIAIAACDLAEVIGSAIALELLFHIPLFFGVLITGLDVLGDPLPAALGIPLHRVAGHRADRHHHCFVRRADVSFPARLLARIARSFDSVAAHRHQPIHALHRHRHSGRDGDAAQPLSALSIVQSRRYERTPEGKREAIHVANIDSALALTIALFVNAAILIVAAAVFIAAATLRSRLFRMRSSF